MYDVCRQLLNQRDYIITEEYEDRLIGEKDIGELEPKKLCIFITNCPKFNTEKTQEYINMMNELEINHSIIIYQDTISSSAKKIIENLPSISLGGDISIKIELFAEHELQKNITKHVLQPSQFELLHGEEASLMKKQYGNVLPVMLKTDPIARFYGYESGNIIKITRKNGYILYRIVK